MPYIRPRRERQNQIKRPRAPHGHWEKWENVEGVIRELEKKLRHFPTHQDLQTNGYSALASVIKRRYDGMPGLRKKMFVPATTEDHGHWLQWENVEKVLRDFKKHEGHYPSFQELQRAGRGSVANAIVSHFGGMAAMRERLGAKQTRLPNGHWKNLENVERAILALRDELDHVPTATEIGRENTALMIGITRFHNGWNQTKQVLGLNTISDDLLATHANDLVRIVIELDVPTDRFWSAMKERWVTRDLTLAIVEFKKTRSVERFRTLLDS